ncbi:aspartate/glutamate racemase family protein [Kordiimonas aquimaris]|uniref:aspartate/glutamate racemase family protein n=1 Tax=Kordiimonas aquimaris TaxID=707591 RepID=UPI0021CF2FE4|nr:aspartate/glutamate racemase family protein [Kordiimonas aquimaris]
MSKIIHIITPIITEGIRSLEDVAPFASENLEFRHSLLDRGPSSIECEYDEAIAVPDTIAKCIEAEQAGADAIVIDCMGDPGMKPCREVVSIPVLGPGETSMHMAAMLGQKFSFVTVVDGVIPMINNLAKIYGLAEKMVSSRVIDMPVLNIEQDIEKTQEKLAEASLEAIRDDGADVIVLGCTGFLGCAEKIIERLKFEGYDVPVIDPIPLTVMTASALIDVGLTHSKKTYAPPRDKVVVGY